MTKQEIRKKLSKHSNGGNSYLVLDYLLDKKILEIQITQAELAKEINKTRPAIQGCLELLVQLGLIKMNYGRIIIIKEGIK